MSATILNSQRLVQLSQFHPRLRNVWYLLAAVTFSVCNKPQEIPLLYHYAMMLRDENSEPRQRELLAARTVELFRNTPLECHREINKMYQLSSSPFQVSLTEKFREAILKTAPLAGLPKAINSLTQLKEYTPALLLPQVAEIDPYLAETDESQMYSETKREKENGSNFRERGLKHWNLVYNKVSKKVVNNLNSSYPDLWYYTMEYVYGPLFSFEDVLDAQETSLVIIAALVPQDVNAQLRGHLRGALNTGCEKEMIEMARDLAILVSQWCNVKCSVDVVKL